MPKKINIDSLTIGAEAPLVFILGPCVIESREQTLRMAAALKELSQTQDFKFIFKASFDKANRTAIDSFRGPGLTKGLKILDQVKTRYGLPLLTDVHESHQVSAVAEVVDVIQIPAFLCRQTDLLVAAGRSGKTINVKKGQFLSPSDIQHIVTKIESTGNQQILLTERGHTFGYSGLITDMRSIPIMQASGYPVVFDATHSAQLPGGSITGGNRAYIPHLARAAVAAGCNGVFMEVHDQVKKAKSDRATQYPLADLAGLIDSLLRISTAIRTDNE